MYHNPALGNVSSFIRGLSQETCIESFKGNHVPTPPSMASSTMIENSVTASSLLSMNMTYTCAKIRILRA